jgi:hypothetical protein
MLLFTMAILLAMLDLHKCAHEAGIGDACLYFNERGAPALRGVTRE